MNKPRGNPSKGGAARTPAKLAALAAARAARKLAPNDPGITARQLATLLGSVSTLLSTKAQPGVVSLRALAVHCECDDKTIRRYLQGVKKPPSTAVKAMQVFVRKHSA